MIPLPVVVHETRPHKSALLEQQEMAFASAQGSQPKVGPFKSAFAPEIYARMNVRGNEYSKEIIQIFSKAFTTPSDESQQFLDIGCGTGDFTRESIAPSCEPYKRIVAVDASESMVVYAKEKYAHEKIVYEYLDIDGDVADFSKKYGTFQRVYSFRTLHWSNDLRRALGNIAQLLLPGGECLLLFCARSFLFESFKKLSQLEPWSKYANVLLGAIPESQDIASVQGQRDYLSAVLSSAALIPYTAEVLVKPYKAHRQGSFPQHIFHMANPLFSLLSQEEQPALVEALSTNLPAWCDSYCKECGPSPWLLFLVHARKPE